MSARTLATLTRFVFVLAIGTGCARQSPTEPDAIGKPQNTSPAIGAAAATASDNPGARVPITFTLKGCPNLPAGLIVYGSGDDFLVINSRVDRDGNTHVERNDLVTGTATDSDGASYKFNYHNHSNIVVPPGGFPWSFATTDHFNLVGNGRANQLQVSFVARVTFPSPNDPPSIEFVNSRGDPFFCDPI